MAGAGETAPMPVVQVWSLGPYGLQALPRVVPWPPALRGSHPQNKQSREKACQIEGAGHVLHKDGALGVIPDINNNTRTT